MGQSSTPYMQFNPLNFRTLPADLPGKIRTDQGMTLISVKPTGEARYGRTVGDKDSIVREYLPSDLLLLAWTGQYRTDVFLLSPADLERSYRR